MVKITATSNSKSNTFFCNWLHSHAPLLHVKFKLCSATVSWTFGLSKCSTTPTEPKTDLSGDSRGWLRPMGAQAIIEMFIGHLAQNGGKLFEITKDIIILNLNSPTRRLCAGGTYTHTVVI